MKKSAHETFYEKIPDYGKYFRTFGEMVVVPSVATIKSKLEYQVKARVFLGYAQNHTGGTYRMLNVLSKRILLSRDSICLNKTYG